MTFSRHLVLPAVLLLSLAMVPMSAERRDNDSDQGGPDRPIQVNCARGDSIQQALDRFPERSEQFTINISGFCREKLVISRKVILRGTDRNTDGIISPADLGTATATINVHGVTGFGTAGAEMVRFEHLSITGSPRLAVTVNTAQLGLTDVTISQNGNHGLLTFDGGSVYADSVTLSDNGGAGILAATGSIRCTNCQITGNSPNGVPGVIAGSGGAVQLFTSTITGRTGVQANGGEVNMFGGSIVVTTRAVIAQSAGRFRFQNDVQVSGAIICGLQSSIDSRRGTGAGGFNQVSNASGINNQILNGCFLLAGPGTTALVGPTSVGAGAYVGTEGPPGVTKLSFGSLSCANGGKVTTTGGTILVNNVPGVPVGCTP